MGLTSYIANLKQAVTEIEQLNPTKEIFSDNYSNSSRFPRISVIVPVYNEVDNIQDCVMSILNSTHLLDEHLEVWIVDDQSTDETLMIIQTLQQSLGDPRLKLIPGRPRPEGQVWIGKNWACAHALNARRENFYCLLMLMSA